MNRTPTRKLRWRTPWEALTGVRPTLLHLKSVGSKCYFLNHNIPKLSKLRARASIGYLVGYQSRNIWRIWHPQKGKIIQHRDVQFDEGTKFDPDDLHELIDLDSYEAVTETVDLGPWNDSVEWSEPAGIDDDTEEPDANGEYDTIVVSETNRLGNLSEDRNALISPIRDGTQTPSVSPTTPSTPPVSLQTPLTSDGSRASSLPAGGVETLQKPDNGVQESSPNLDTRTQDRRSNFAPRASEISGTPSNDNILPEGSKRKRQRRLAGFAAEENSEQPLAEYYKAFATALTLSSSHDCIQTTSDDLTKLRIHRDTLPPEPSNWSEMKRHSFYKYFLDAAHTEFAALNQRGTFRKINRESHYAPLPLLWVFKYKFDTDGYLVKFKARICVRGDLQTTHINDNYAATLAVRIFRALMALTASFNLEILQLDAVNAFLNSEIDEEVIIQWPPGLEPPVEAGTPRQVLQLLKALYGLKQAPLLWHDHLVDLLQQLGLKRVPGVNCVLVSDWLILFFYVDDIVLLFTKENRTKAEEFVTRMKTELQLREITDANWFLGIRIVRDRSKRLLWLCQDSYIEKLAARFNVDPKTTVLAHTPLPSTIPGAYNGEATAGERYGYQSRVGSINFAAVVTRPDIAKACSILSQHLRNPGPEHLNAADRVLSYLTRTKHLAIQFGDGIYQAGQEALPPFLVYSDAAFADNLDRKSSDGYLFMLYNGAIDWRASKQTTVTTSSTEAELLALSRTAKELMAWKRFFNGIRYNFDDDTLIYSDNTQTIRLLSQNEPLLTTKLRHVDIHQHWLREKVQDGEINIEWTSTTTMKADGLTKPLSRQPFERFVRQLNLINIQGMINR
jgi:Reverse transcriptase (RNA-dependent DNA polymerase)